MHKNGISSVHMFWKRGVSMYSAAKKMSFIDSCLFINNNLSTKQEEEVHPIQSSDYALG
jgi:hypothetical protein